MMKLTDQEIVDQLKNGNTSVFKFLYNDFNKITKFVTQNSGNEEDAKDYFHEALIVLYEKIVKNEFELKSRLSTYLYAVCKNLWLYHIRDNKTLLMENVEQNTQESDLQIDDLDAFSKKQVYEDKLNLIVEKINELKEPCLSILKMFYFNKLSFKEIADKLNYKTEKVVKNQKYRCIQKIKEDFPANFIENY